MANERIVHCPKCGHVLRRTGIDSEHYKSLGIVVYDVYCDQCDITMTVSDMSSYEQEGRITIEFT